MFNYFPYRKYFSVDTMHMCMWASHVALVVKNQTANEGDITDMVRFLGQEDPLQEGMETHSSILAWRIPRREEPGRLWPIGLQSQTQLK